MINDNPFLKQYYQLQPIANWISVDEALPKSGERVIVVCTNPWSVNKVPHVSMATYHGKLTNGKLHWTRYKDVTHWMYPPELPEYENSKFLDSREKH